MPSNELFLFSSHGSEIEIDKKEAMRYMGIRSAVSDGELDALYDECLALYSEAAFFKAVSANVRVRSDGENVDLGFFVFKSKCLSLNLRGKDEAVIFAATSGAGVDRLIMKYSKTERAKALVIDAIASAGIEAFCDRVNEKLADGRATSSRYSPGYGDLSLDVQPYLLDYLDAQRKLGIVLNERLFMTPTKSVTAIFGVK